MGDKIVSQTLSETSLASAVRNTSAEAQYDAACKRLISEKEILARILKSCVEEFENTTIEEIRDHCIEGTPQVGKVPVLPDEKMPIIKGIGTEDATVNEGIIRYDIRFVAKAPKSEEPITLIINVEAQNDFYPGYPIVKRGIYNCSRMISSQYGTEFIKSQYNKIKKVYSIWICTSPPKYRENTIANYSIQETSMFGRVEEKKEHYDVLSTLMICLGNIKQTKTNDLLKLLAVLLTNEIGEAEKKRVLIEEYQIKMTENLEKEVNQMCNLSQGILQKGIEEGTLKGIEEGKIESAKSLLDVLSDEIIAEKLKIELNLVKELRKEALSEQ